MCCKPQLKYESAENIDIIISYNAPNPGNRAVAWGLSFTPSRANKRGIAIIAIPYAVSIGNYGSFEPYCYKVKPDAFWHKFKLHPTRIAVKRDIHSC